ncbi:hypothetical protein [Yaniella flava]|uniref:hypothetical protein n=1 Tax=Yaniella flava TaxID=287930 RepID=UPI0031CF8BF2
MHQRLIPHTVTVDREDERYAATRAITLAPQVHPVSAADHCNTSRQPIRTSCRRREQSNHAPNLPTSLAPPRSGRTDAPHRGTPNRT